MTFCVVWCLYIQLAVADNLRAVFGIEVSPEVLAGNHVSLLIRVNVVVDDAAFIDKAGIAHRMEFITDCRAAFVFIVQQSPLIKLSAVGNGFDDSAAGYSIKFIFLFLSIVMIHQPPFKIVSSYSLYLQTCPSVMFFVEIYKIF